MDTLGIAHEEGKRGDGGGEAGARPTGIAILAYVYAGLAVAVLLSSLVAWIFYGWYLAQGATQESFSAIWVGVLSLVAAPLTPLLGGQARGAC